eukprot:Amastigsp_a174563_369.p3 type:complete len:140 gc:universal Amastigsp_a174563_369:712-293(-)
MSFCALMPSRRVGRPEGSEMSLKASPAIPSSGVSSKNDAITSAIPNVKFVTTTPAMPTLSLSSVPAVNPVPYGIANTRASGSLFAVCDAASLYVVLPTHPPVLHKTEGTQRFELPLSSTTAKGPCAGSPIVTLPTQISS